MTAYCVIVERVRTNQGRNKNQDYVNVLASQRALNGVSTVAEWLLANPGHPWNDSQLNEFIVEVTLAEFNAINDGTNPLFHDGNGNLPRWQQQTAGSGSAKAFGSFADPTNDASTFTLDVPLEDTRWIVRIYDGDPLTSGIHVATEEFDEAAAGTTVSRNLRLFNSDDTPSGTNAQNQRTEIGGKLMDFDFTSGIAPFNVAVDRAGTGFFPSNSRYRVIGPSGEKEYIWQVFGKTIEVEAD